MKLELFQFCLQELICKVCKVLRMRLFVIQAFSFHLQIGLIRVLLLRYFWFCVHQNLSIVGGRINQLGQPCRWLHNLSFLKFQRMVKQRKQLLIHQWWCKYLFDLISFFQRNLLSWSYLHRSLKCDISRIQLIFVCCLNLRGYLILSSCWIVNRIFYNLQHFQKFIGRVQDIS